METIIPLVEGTKKAALIMKDLDATVLNAVLHDMADSLIENQGIILNLNKQDVKNGNAMLLSPHAMDRLELNNERLNSMAIFIRNLAGMSGRYTLKSDEDGIIINPSSTLAVIYESRPYLSARAATIAFRSGNAVILRGGKEAFHTNTAITSILCDVLDQNGLPRELINLLPTTDRVSMTELIGLNDLIDFVIPEGSDGLLQYITKNSKIPVINKLSVFEQ